MVLKMAGCDVAYGTRFSAANLRIEGLGWATNPTSCIPRVSSVLWVEYLRGEHLPPPVLLAWLPRLVLITMNRANPVTFFLVAFS